MRLRTFTAGLAAFVAALPLMATSVYTYTGNNFDFVSSPPGPYTLSDSVTGSFSLGSPLTPNLQLSDNDVTPISFSFSDGVQTLSSGRNLTKIFFDIATDPNGNILFWFISLSDDPASDRIITSNYLPLTVIDFGGMNSAEGQLLGDPGHWTTSTVVPEPGNLIPVAAGLIAVGAVVLRRSRQRTA